MKNCNWTEEAVVDYVLGHMNGERHNTFLTHLETCSECQLSIKHWANVFEEKLNDSPSIKLQQRILKSIKWIEKRKRPSKQKAVALAVTAIAMVFFFMLGRYSKTITAKPIFNQHITQVRKMSSDPALDQTAYKVIPVQQNNMQGYIWVNKDTNELYLFIDGLKQETGKDYQAWISTAHHLSNGGLLQWDQNFAHMYLHSQSIPKIDHVMISLEPEGGSTAPTGPKTLYVPLNNN